MAKRSRRTGTRRQRSASEEADGADQGEDKPEEVHDSFDPVAKLDADLQRKIDLSGRRQARSINKTYYQEQEMRKTTDSRIRALKNPKIYNALEQSMDYPYEKFTIRFPRKVDGEIKQITQTKKFGDLLIQNFLDGLPWLLQQPFSEDQQRAYDANITAIQDWRPESHELLKDYKAAVVARERHLKVQLGAWAAKYHIGLWIQSLPGLGPVSSSGCLTYFDPRRAATYGHYWSYAGLSKHIIWESKETILAKAAEWDFPEKGLTEIQIKQLAREFGRAHFDPAACLEEDEWSLDNVASTLAKRPFNMDLKTLCAFKIGECLIRAKDTVKKTGDKEVPNIYYPIYVERKAVETELNAQGAYAEQAAREIKHVHKSTSAYKCYKKGMLPPGHIHSRCRRNMVQMFLAHLHHVSFEDYFQGEKAPTPYPFTHHCKDGKDHRHEIKPPNWPFAGGGLSLRELFGAPRK